MSRTDVEEAVARHLRDEAADAPSGRAVVARVRARTVNAAQHTGRRSYLAPLAAAAIVVVVLGAIAVPVIMRVGPGAEAQSGAHLTSGGSGGGGACRLADLRVSSTGATAKGGDYLIIRLWNPADPCTLKGYPSIVLENQSNSGTEPRNTLSGLFGGYVGGVAPPPVELGHNVGASVMVEADALDTPQLVACGGVETLLLTVRSGDEPVRIPMKINTCGLQVHPFVAGDWGIAEAPMPRATVSFPYRAHTECGLSTISLYGMHWLADRPLLDPSSRNRPYRGDVDGTMTVFPDDTLKFTVADAFARITGRTVTLHPTNKLPPCGP